VNPVVHFVQKFTGVLSESKGQVEAPRSQAGSDRVPAGGAATKEVPIPAELVGSVVGPNGVTIAEIRTKVGGMPVEVRAPDVVGMPHRAILGPGQQEQLLAAEHLLAGKLAEAALQRQPM